MFEEQYRSDNEKLCANETLLTKLKNEQDHMQHKAAENAVQRSFFTRYGAVAAAAMFVVGGALGLLLGTARKTSPDVTMQSAKKPDVTESAEFIEDAPAEAIWAAKPEVALAAQAASQETAQKEDVRALADYAELYGLIEQMQLGGANLFGLSRSDAVAPAAEEAASEPASGSAADMPATDSGAATAAADTAIAKSNGGYSETNTQVKGVDEADIIKTDGKYIYYVAGNQLNIILADGEKTKILSSTMLTGNDAWWAYSAEMFLRGNRLMVIAQGYATAWMKSSGGGNTESQREQTRALIYDVSDPVKPRMVGDLAQSGSYVSSRMIDDYVYLVTSQNVWNIVRNEPVTYVPQLTSAERTRLVSPNDILVCGAPESASFTVIGTIDLARGTDYASAKAVFGNTGEIYCNGSHLLLSSNQYQQVTGDIAPDETGKNVRITTSSSSTRLMLFSLDGAKVTVLSNAMVPGTLLNQFAMDEYDGVFRLVTTVNNWTERIYTDGVDTYEYDDETYNCLYTLDSELNVLGSLTELAGDEWVESVRFDGSIGYFVTFRQVDPLFAVDLRDPANPTLLSTLKIPGFSEYLHVFGDELLMGLGYDADEKTGRTEGVKLTMFDTSNPRDVRELATQRVDASWTAVGSNHHAILADPALNLIAFPADDAYYIYRYTAADAFEQLARIQMQGDLSSWNLRGLFIGDCFYVVGESGVTVISMQSWERIAECTISYG